MIKLYHMPEKMTFEKKEEISGLEEISSSKKEIGPEKVKNLPDWEEPGAYY